MGKLPPRGPRWSGYVGPAFLDRFDWMGVGGAYGSIIGTGLLMGVIHVLSGPDHLSALATLSVGSTYKAFYLGVRWGLGHSTGLVVIAFIFLALKGQLNLEKLESYCDWIVGVFMILLGLWGILDACKKERSRKEKEAQSNGRATSISVRTGPQEPVSGGKGRGPEGVELIYVADEEGGDLGRDSKQEDRLVAGEEDDRAAVATGDGPATVSTVGQDVSIVAPSEPDDEMFKLEGLSVRKTEFMDSQKNLPRWCVRVNLRNPSTQRVMAFGVGIVHGIAGPGGILGVLPAVQLHDWGKSLTYLFTFCLTSTLIMGVFASLYGEITHRCGASESAMSFYLHVFSSMLSVAVGAIWLLLLFTGKLHEVFD